jgi:alpha-L-rhamnosidase
MIKAVNLKTEHMINPVGIDITYPRLSWTCEGAALQSAYRVQAVNQHGQEIFDSGKTLSRAMNCVYRGDVRSRDRVTWTVRLWDEGDVQGESANAFFERAIDKDDWRAAWINPEPKINPKIRNRASYLKRDFNIDSTGSARLYITAHGIYTVYLNGMEIDSFLFAPGTSQYDKRLAVQTYDVSELLCQGKNDILVSLGDGWYRGNVSNQMMVNTFGTDVALLCQLEIDGKVILASDENWLASQDGPLGLNDLMNGEEYDAQKETITNWHPVKLETFSLDNLIGQNSPAVTRHEKFKAKLIKTANGERVLDFGQNLAGFVEFEIDAKAGQKIILWHGETLDENGNFTIENFQSIRGKRREQKIVYTCREGKNHYHPTKCFFGFRYVKIESDIEITGEEFTGIAVYSDMEQTGFFTCGNEEVNQLFRNALWSMKSNFLDVPTDCPTREKSGFSGDCQAYIDTAMFLMNCYPVYRKWLLEQQATQDAEGIVKMVAPDNRAKRHFVEGSAGWCDSIEIVPYKLWLRYSDDTPIKENYECMKKWLRFCLKRAARKVRFENRGLPEELKPYFVDRGMHWGEWLEPGTDVVKYMTKIAFHGEPEVATAYLSYGCALVGEMARRLGENEDATFFAGAAEKARQAYRYVFIKTGEVVDSPHQCRYVRPIALGLLSNQEKSNNAALLAGKIAGNDYKLNTGFLTTHELCRVLTDYGQVETAYRLLLQDGCPGWLYPVKEGATSIWETWDAVKESGKVSGSLNHYAYGAIVGWLFDSVCGIRLNRGQITIQPQPCSLLGSASAVYHSPFGTVESSWKYTEQGLIFIIVVPCNTGARVILPDGTKEEAGPGRHEYRIFG